MDSNCELDIESFFEPSQISDDKEYVYEKYSQFEKHISNVTLYYEKKAIKEYIPEKKELLFSKEDYDNCAKKYGYKNCLDYYLKKSELFSFFDTLPYNNYRFNIQYITYLYNFLEKKSELKINSCEMTSGNIYIKNILNIDEILELEFSTLYCKLYIENIDFFVKNKDIFDKKQKFAIFKHPYKYCYSGDKLYFIVLI